ncbi:MAG: aspartate kinase [Bacteroidales bacterium]|nr:aspartate kinase [Bacteroidales bacterium]
MLKVFKFGGASVKDAQAVRNVARIIETNCKDRMVVVLSAMGKMTNAFETLVDNSFHQKPEAETQFAIIKSFHSEILESLFPDPNHLVYVHINNIFHELKQAIKTISTENYDSVYDRIVPYGEFLSTSIVADYLNDCKISTQLLNAQELIKTDENHRSADINWELSIQEINHKLSDSFWDKNNIALTQGFIGSSTNETPTTLGREGSDFTASIFAYALNAVEVTIWKDVPGLLNADPKLFDKTKLLSHISFQEAIELAYYGAKIIHPKTIKPLQNKNIPLRVKSFENPMAVGTIINNENKDDDRYSSIIVKENQLLVSLATKDFSFIAENHLHTIYGLLSELRIQLNTIQNSAISFSLCFDFDREKLDKFIKRLSNQFHIRYNSGLTMYTLRHYNEEIISEYIGSKTVIMEQRSRVTAQFLLK